MSTLRLQRIETFLYRADVSEAVKTSFGSIPRRSALLLRVEDRDGTHGWGEVWCNFPPFSADNKANLIETIVAPAALASEFESPTHAWQTLTEKTRRWAIQSGEPGPISACLAGLDLALWDLEGRRKGQTLTQLLDPLSNKVDVPAYASGLNPDTAVRTIEHARTIGFTKFKFKVGFGLEQDLQALAEVTSQIRANERVMVDANQGWDMPQARKAVAAFRRYDLGWIEEPIPADSPAGDWAELAMLSRSPIAGGENVAGFGDFASLINQRHHKVVQPDLLKWGGVTGSFAVGRNAVQNGLTYCPHWLGSGLGLAASAHLLAAVGGAGLLEHDVMENPLREVLAAPFPRVTNGRYPLPMGPGLGVEPSVNEASRWLINKRSFTRP